MTDALAGQVQQPEKIHALTSLRFFAALYVVFHHTSVIYWPGIRLDSLLGRFFDLGYISVNFFFLLSGYILAVVYLRRGGEVQQRSFLRARFARVYPLFLLTLLMDAPILFLERWATFGLKIATLKTTVIFIGKALMLQAWIPQLRGMDDPNWSLSVETLFYLSFPLLGVALWKLRGARLWVVAVLVYLGGLLVSYESFRRIQGDLSSHLPLVNLYTFALGILLARWQILRREQETHDRRKIRRWATLISAAGLVAFSALVYWSPQIPNSNLLVGLLVPVFLGSIWAFSQSDWLPARLMSARWLVVLGEASYGLYLFHLPVYHWFRRAGWGRDALWMPVYLAASIGLSVLSFYYFETPARRWILKRGQVRVKETMEMASDAQ